MPWKASAIVSGSWSGVVPWSNAMRSLRLHHNSSFSPSAAKNLQRPSSRCRLNSPDFHGLWGTFSTAVVFAITPGIALVKERALNSLCNAVHISLGPSLGLLFSTRRNARPTALLAVPNCLKFKSNLNATAPPAMPSFRSKFKDFALKLSHKPNHLRLQTQGGVLSPCRPLKPACSALCLQSFHFLCRASQEARALRPECSSRNHAPANPE